MDSDGVADDMQKESTLKEFAKIAGKQYELPNLEDAPICFMLGPAESDAIMNGPVIVARNLEKLRTIIDEVRAELRLGKLHLDSKIHMSICRLTGKGVFSGERNDLFLRQKVAPNWPRSGNFPDVLTSLPLPGQMDGPLKRETKRDGDECPHCMAKKRGKHFAISKFNATCDQQQALGHTGEQ